MGSAPQAPSEAPESSENSEVTRILVVDDHEVVRAGLTAALTADPLIHVVAAAATGAEALGAVRRDRPHVAVVDMRLPDMSGDDLCRRLLELAPDLSVVVLSSYLTEAAVRDAVRAGASGYVTKAAGLAELRAAIDEARSARDRPDHRPSVSQIVRRLEQLVGDRERSGSPTPQQGRVLDLAVQGMTYSEIARTLRISESTVRFHIQKLKVRFGVRSRTELAVQALRAGLVDAPDAEATS